MKILDGKKLSQKIKEQIKAEVEDLKQHHGITPGLAVILVGDDPASHTYVKMKAKACKEVGFYSIVHEMPDDISQEKIEDTIKMMNKNPNIDGILVQLPLPPHIDTTRILELIDPAKDVDGFHPYNFGRLMQGLETFAPCTPLGVMELLKEYSINPQGLDVCVVGASNIVGKPMAALLLNANATVDICHIYTKDLQSHTKRADMVVVGVGKPSLITADMVKDGVIIIDIGINRLDDGRLVGDVDFEEVSKKASYITPVPGGVGPMTIAMLLQNTLKAAKKRITD
ncbi:bifunctional methylenetetrahydrofolate dehydrogenase/methenyltetrahydrofolate cyclohydrolase FolD [Nitratiruptor sp. YY09-18]|uniref:bifunctional methylenetetrahydrofolate dehydrogenase/methenyltetrahydrofolate cyclohydrolase FolD n=1 Tax=Nitratiruptor sp. YY09-18 TaxID=2724901 RepID=UPI001916B247|nr:bifunctional methylenetetrahydrofolate dehydrogenase/methenyltetrahydrofolate cyclohydrolase FolD [Nitratiruptor sp. YY09-18]BCD67913.1 methylenetetrahydrofolate dehydrogenase (NADP+) / methenyltetrahydrofolate cyclohydrolase [Nitratiruptor sp. YY09-18]